MTKQPDRPIIVRIAQGECGGVRTTLYINLANVSTVTMYEQGDGAIEVDFAMLASRVSDEHAPAQGIHVTGTQAKRVVALLDRLAKVDYTA